MFNSILTFCKSPKISLMLMLISTLLSSVVGIFIKKATEKGVPSTELSLIRDCGMAIIVIFPLAWFQKVPLLPPKSVRLKVALRGIFGSFSLNCYFKAIQCLPIGDAITLYCIYPSFTVLFAIPFLGERLNIIKVIAILISSVGAVCTAQPNFLFVNFGWTKPKVRTSDCLEWGYATAFAGGFFVACQLIVMRMIANDAHTIHLMFSRLVFTIIVSVIFYFFDEDWVFPEGEERLDILLMILSGSAASVTLNYAGRLCHAGAGSIMLSTNVVWAYLWQITIFNIRPTILPLVGAVLIFASGLIIALSKERVSNQCSSLLTEKNTGTGYFPLPEGKSDEFIGFGGSKKWRLRHNRQDKLAARSDRHVFTQLRPKKLVDDSDIFCLRNISY